ncbi:hypothetical protein SLEP1_g26835 [Rubroshorea leprosula]|uniref:Uncharacterized protein n=1 Tax=Rubroshorea leprosula TaxID=152421 RepID=A0AAV5JUG5_9ROSI|nr:hypothetical protein SLEP1_g26835 [Rubroshorea leprosula]
MPYTINFNALRDLHNSANDLLHSPMIQKALLHQGHEKWVHQVSESSLQMLDVLGISRDVLLLVKDNVQDLRFALRRVSTDDVESNIRTEIAVYTQYRKKLKKETLNGGGHADGSQGHDDLHCVAVISVFHPLVGERSGKGSFGLKIIRSGCKDFYGISDELAVQSLEAVEVTIEDLEVELD